LIVDPFAVIVDFVELERIIFCPRDEPVANLTAERRHVRLPGT
jgi:hypothetical protein